MANIAYDTLTITINADSQQANRSINTLSKNLRKLDETAKEIDKQQIEQVKGLLLDIANIDFSNVSKGLHDVVTAFKQLNKATSGNALGASPLGAVDFSSLPEDIQSKMGTALGTYAELADEIGRAKIELVDVNKELDKQKSKLKDVNKETSKFGKALNKLTKDFTRILKYRVYRKAIQAVYKALGDGLKQIAIADDKTNESLTQITSSFNYLTTAIGTVVAPIVQILEPVLVSLSDLLAEVADEWAQYLSAMAGNKEYAKAIKNIKDYRAELQKTQSIGIDELNIIQQQDSNTQLTPIDQKVLDETQEFREAWEEIVKLIINLKPIFKSLNSSAMKPTIELVAELLDLLALVVDIISPVINLTFDDVNGSLGESITLVGLLVDILEKMLTFIRPALDLIYETIATAISVVVDYFFMLINTAKNTINNTIDLFEALFHLIHGLFTHNAFELLTAFDEFGASFKKIGIDIANFFIRTLNKLSGLLADFAQFFVNIAGTVASWFGADTSGWNVEIPKINELSYATGGFPEDGLFFANHNELVGQFSNGQTAVANNEQITQGIYEAVKQALQESGGDKEVVIEMDGYEVARIVTEKQNNFGASLVKGGNLKFGT